MSFYADLRGSYDELFPLSAELSSLLEWLARSAPPGVMADVGCGTGNQALALARYGRGVVAIDPDPSMVAAARGKLSSHPGVRVDRGGFRRLRDVAGTGFSGVICVGNTLVHAPPPEAARFVEDAFSVLLPGGFLLLQILNYGRLPKEGAFSLPDLVARGGAVRFRRHFRHISGGRLLFRGELFFPGAAGETCRRENEVTLWPILPEELDAWIDGAGFTPVHRFGDFSRSPFQPESEACVCIAFRP